MNYLQRSFLASVKACDESTLMLSRKDCHQLGLDSIVIENNGGRLTRAFFAHGHLHNKLVEVDGVVDNRYFNACVEHTDWKPISYQDIIKITGWK